MSISIADAIRFARVSGFFASSTALTCSRLCEGASAVHAAFVAALLPIAFARSGGTLSVGSG